MIADVQTKLLELQEKYDKLSVSKETNALPTYLPHSVSNSIVPLLYLLCVSQQDFVVITEELKDTKEKGKAKEMELAGEIRSLLGMKGSVDKTFKEGKLPLIYMSLCA